jgi:hypothetical protein
MARRLLLSAVAGVLAAAGLAGCGGPSDPLASVLAAVRNSQSHTFIADVALTGAEALGARPTQQLLGRGAFDVRRGLAYERVDLPGPLDANKRPSRDYLVYQSTRILIAPAARTALPAGKRIIAVPLARRGAEDAIAAQFVEQAMGLNPLLLLDQIAWGGAAASKTGSELLKHVHFTDYGVKVDLRRALARLRGPFARAERLATREELAALGSGRSVVHVTVRVDSAGFVRGLEATVPGSRLGSLEMDLYGYGTRFEPSFPTAAEIVQLRSLVTSSAWTPQSPWIFAAA